MNKRTYIVEIIKDIMPREFNSRQLYNYLHFHHVKIGLHETARYIYRLRQMGFLVDTNKTVGIVPHRRENKLWKIADYNFTTKGKNVGLTSAIHRAIAASGNEFFLRQFKRTLNNYTREDMSGYFTKLRKIGKLTSQKTLLKNTNLYFKPMKYCGKI